MNNSNGYISLSEATKYCNYSQEYLSLRARQGKLKAVKFGRNWVTKKEWLEEYLKRNKKLIQPPENLPIEKTPVLRFGFVFSLVLALAIFSFALGKDSLKATFQELEPQISKINQPVEDFLADCAQSISMVAQEIAKTKFGSQLAEIGKTSSQNLRDYFSWLKEKYLRANQIVEEKLSHFGFVLKEKIKKPFQPKVVFVGKTEKDIEELKLENEKLKSRIEKLEKQKLPTKEVIREVSRITKIEPIKEIIKETISAPALKQLANLQQKVENQESQIENLKKELKRRPTGFVSSPTIIQPVSNAPDLHKLYAENDQITLEAAGSGNIVFSAASNILAESTNFTISSSNLNITSSVTLTGDLEITGSQSFTASSTSPALSVTQNGSGEIVKFSDGESPIFTLADGGYATLAVEPNLSHPSLLIKNPDTSWTQTSSTYLGIVATSTFSGNFLNFQKSGQSIFTLSSEGNLIATGTVTAASFYSASTDSTVRKSGEEVFRGKVSIYRFGLPSQTATTTYIRISKIITGDPMANKPSSLPGAQRKYRFAIKYADDLDSGGSEWRIYDLSNSTTTATFTVPYIGSSVLEEGKPYLTDLLDIPSGDWELDLKLPVSGKHIRIFDILLVAYDVIQ